MSLVDIMRRKNLGDRQEPVVNGALPPSISPEVAAFIDSSTRQREELTYFRSHSAQLENDVKLANERIRALEAELHFVRDERDALYRHDQSMLRSMRNIKVLIMDAEQDARDSAYAPPGSGTQQQAVETELDKELAKTVAEEFAPAPVENQ